MEREDRMKALYLFKTGVERILVTTNMGENGINYNNVDTIINFNFPRSGSSYLKRAQKISKNNIKKREMINFFQKSERRFVDLMIRLIQSNSKIEPTLTII